MTFLLDTHVLLWWLADPARLSEKAHAIVADRSNRLLWSSASTWELAIKASLGRLALPEALGAYLPSRLARQHIDSLPVVDRHASEVANLPPHHRDPFDRMLIAQARVEALRLLSSDEVLRRYEVEVVW